MKDTDTITVYWAPSAFIASEEPSWLMLYSNPISINSFLRLNKSSESKNNMFICPASNDHFNNTYMFTCNLSDDVTFPNYPQEFYYQPERVVLNTNSRISLIKPRPSSLIDHMNVVYNMGWIFLADEPLTAVFTAPYYPPTAPALGAKLSAGQFNIGLWFRSYQLDYHVPYKTKNLIFNENDPFFYIKFLTNKKIIFKQFIFTPLLSHLSDEMSNASHKYGFFKSLKNRYEIAHNASIIDHVKTEIKKNLIE